MPITNAKTVPGPGTAGDTPECIYCHQPVIPCKCQPECTPPFQGKIHLVTSSHLCAFPKPGNTFGEIAQ